MEAPQEETRTTAPLSVSLPRLLERRALSLRALADRVSVNVSHLSRAVRGVGNSRVSGDLAARIAVALDLPEDFFLETREQSVVAAVHADPELCDRIYDSLRLASD